jgi:hypothetical protein
MTNRDSNLSISACEYAAPTTIFGSWLVGIVTFLLGVCSRGGGLQNGEADLGLCQFLSQDAGCLGQRTLNGLCVNPLRASVSIVCTVNVAQVTER